MTKYFEKIMEIGIFILKTFEENGYKVLEKKLLKEAPNKKYHRIINNGGIGLRQYYGPPSSFCTPAGYISITGSIGTGNEKKVMEILTEKLGLIIFEPMVINNMGKFGPTYHITKDLDGNKLPKIEIAPKEFDDKLIKEYNSIWDKIQKKAKE